MNLIIAIITISFFWRFVRFLTTPMFRRIGFYRYYSPLFFIVKYVPGWTEIHMGTLWDFLMLKKNNKPNVMIFLLEGLVRFCEDVENGVIGENTNIKGHIHFLGTKTLVRFGLVTRRLNPVEYFMTILSYVELMVINTISLKRFSFIRISDGRVLSCRAGDLARNKDKYILLLSQLKKRRPGNSPLKINESGEARVA